MLFKTLAILAFASSISAQCSTVWSQCGGTGFTGSTTCCSGSVCQYTNEWYSQCVPGGTTTSTKTTTTTTRASSSTSTTKSSTTTTKTTSTAAAATATGFVKTSGRTFTLNGCTKYFSATNTYYLLTSASTRVDTALDVVAKHPNMNVVRVWAFCESSDCGNGPMVSFSNGAVTVNTANLVYMDYMVYAAKQRNIRLIMVLTNNWKDYGGMDAYTSGLGGTYHDDFYTKSTIKAGFKTYINALLTRTNTYTGVKYNAEPAIFGWEIANEARCSNGGLATSGTCTPAVITAWYDEIAKYIKTIDTNHIVGTGDEGLGVTIPSGYTPTNSYAYSTSEGTNFTTSLALSSIDFGTFHFYPIGWGLTNIPTEGNQWITAHANVGKALNKPIFFEEFGLTDKTLRATNYNAWYQSALDNGVAGMGFWMTSGADYADYDGYTLYDADITTLIDPWSAKFVAKNSC